MGHGGDARFDPRHRIPEAFVKATKETRDSLAGLAQVERGEGATMLAQHAGATGQACLDLSTFLLQSHPGAIRKYAEYVVREVAGIWVVHQKLADDLTKFVDGPRRYDPQLKGSALTNWTRRVKALRNSFSQLTKFLRIFSYELSRDRNSGNIFEARDQAIGRLRAHGDDWIKLSSTLRSIK